MKLLTALLLVALTCAAETKPPEPKSKEPTTRVVVIAPVVRVPYRYYGYNLLGNLIGSGIRTGIESWREKKQNERIAQQSAEPEPYIRQSFEPPALAEIRIESNQPGAEVFIDAKSYGPAPVSVLLNPGSRYVAVHATGFENWSKEIDARAGEPQTVTAELKKPPEDLTVIVIKPSTN